MITGGRLVGEDVEREVVGEGGWLAFIDAGRGRFPELVGVHFSEVYAVIIL